MSNLAERMLASADADPEAVAIRLDDRVTSYSELATAALRVASLLTSSGVQPGDRVGLMMPNTPEFPISYYGILLAGGVVVPMNPLLKAKEVAHYLGDSGAKTVLAWHNVPGEPAEGAEKVGAEVIEVDPATFTEVLAAHEPGEAVAREDSDTAVVLYTSGTTGQPKGAELSHSSLRRNADVFASEDWLAISSSDVVMGCLPLFHTFGQTVSMNCTIFRGASLSMVSRFDGPGALDVIERDRITIFVGVPTMYSAILTAGTDREVDVSSLRLCVSGGAALPVEVLRSFEDRFGCTIIEGYGLSETSPVACFNPPNGVRKPGTVGLPIDGVEIHIVDDEGAEVARGERGEIAIRGHNVMKGYLGRPEATAEAISDDGWFRTGDIGIQDEDGYTSIVDRKKSLIIRGGYNVYPREIEETLYEHPAVREAAVIGLAHAELGEEVGAAVVLVDGADVTETEIRDFVKKRVAAYKYPRHVWFMSELPKTATGKILHREVQAPESVG